jgi:hypothetical protein
VEAIIGTIEMQHVLLVIGALVVIMPQLVVDRGEVVSIHLDAHLDADIVLVVDIPGAGMAHDLAVGRLHELRTLPEGFGQRRKAQRREECLTALHHLHRVILLGLEQFGHVIADIPRAVRCDDIINVAPFLRPHVAEQIGADRAGLGCTASPYFSLSLLRV